MHCSNSIADVIKKLTRSRKKIWKTRSCLTIQSFQHFLFTFALRRVFLVKFHTSLCFPGPESIYEPLHSNPDRSNHNHRFGTRGNSTVRSYSVGNRNIISASVLEKFSLAFCLRKSSGAYRAGAYRFTMWSINEIACYRSRWLMERKLIGMYDITETNLNFQQLFTDYRLNT